jgi:hypothetical protein
MSVQCVKHILEAGAWIHKLFRENLAAPGIYWLRRRRRKEGQGETSAAQREKANQRNFSARERCSCRSNKVNES